MKKHSATGLLMLFCIATAFTQSITSDYFEVYTKLAYPRLSSGFSFNKDSILARINGMPDTASTFATFVVSVSDVTNVDSLLFTLTNSQASTVYSGGGTISSLSGSSFKVNNNTLYYTVGPFPYLKRFSATARVRGNDGQSTPIKSFAKN